MFLFIDTETTGLPRRYGAPASELANWPRMVQLAWARFSETGEELEAVERLIQPEGYRIPPEVVRIHGITTERASREGEPLANVLDEFASRLRAAPIVIAHNLHFDENVLTAEYLRQRLPSPFQEQKRICTMLGSTRYCALPGRRGPKWPTLPELHRVLFGSYPLRGHQALRDVRTCARCYFELRRRQVLG